MGPTIVFAVSLLSYVFLSGLDKEYVYIFILYKVMFVFFEDRPGKANNLFNLFATNYNSYNSLIYTQCCKFSPRNEG